MKLANDTSKHNATQSASRGLILINTYCLQRPEYSGSCDFYKKKMSNNFKAKYLKWSPGPMTYKAPSHSDVTDLDDYSSWTWKIAISWTTLVNDDYHSSG